MYVSLINWPQFFLKSFTTQNTRQDLSHQAENQKVVVKFDLSNKGHFILPVNNGNAWVNSRGIQWPQNPFILMVLR